MKKQTIKRGIMISVICLIISAPNFIYSAKYHYENMLVLFWFSMCFSALATLTFSIMLMGLNENERQLRVSYLRKEEARLLVIIKTQTDYIRLNGATKALERVRAEIKRINN